MNEISTPKEMPITTQFCAKATGIRHEYVVRAFNQLLAKSLKNKNTQIEYSYESYTYDSATHKSVIAFRMEYELGIMLMSRLDVFKIPEMLKSARRTAQQPKPPLLLEAESTIKRLENQLMSTRTETLRSVAKRQHVELQKLVDTGVLESHKIVSTRWEYKVTEYGLALGYDQNKNGTVLPPQD